MVYKKYKELKYSKMIVKAKSTTEAFRNVNLMLLDFNLRTGKYGKAVKIGKNIYRVYFIPEKRIRKKITYRR